MFQISIADLIIIQTLLNFVEEPHQYDDTFYTIWNLPSRTKAEKFLKRFYSSEHINVEYSIFWQWNYILLCNKCIQGNHATRKCFKNVRIVKDRHKNSVNNVRYFFSVSL